MPKEYLHKAQCEHNREFYNEPIFNGDKYNDWRVVVMFYEAVHLVEAYFAAHGNLHCASHENRRNAIRGDAEIREIYAPYDDLYSTANLGRYHCATIGTRQVCVCQTDLDVIRKKLVPLMAK